MKGFCPIPGCGREYQPQGLMCEAHWALVPETIKAALGAAYQRGQTRQPRRRTREWMKAERLAFQAVLERQLQRRTVHA